MKKCLIIIACIFNFVKLNSQCLPEYGLNTRKLKVDSVVINYIDQGKGDAVLLIHGLGGNASHWRKIIPSLSLTNRCIALDLPGYGASSFPGEANAKEGLKFYASSIAQFIKKLKLKNITVVGHSMGGQIAIILALQHPDLIGKMILAAPAGLESFTESEAGILKKYATAAFYQQQDSATISKSVQSNFYNPNEETARLIKERIRFRNCNHFNSYCNQIELGVNAMLNNPVKTQLKGIKQPTLIVFGLNDALIPNKLLHPTLSVIQVAEIGKQIPLAKIVYIEKAGHLLQLDQPAEFMNAIKNFLP